MIEVSEKFSVIINNPWAWRKTYIYLTHKAVLEHLEPSQAEFSDIFDAADKRRAVEHCLTPTEDQLQDHLDAWFERINLDDQKADPDLRGTGPPVDNRQIRFRLEAGRCDIMMYRCSWCSNPSAALRKCMFFFDCLPRRCALSD